MALFFSIILAACLLMIVLHFWQRVAGPKVPREEWRLFLRWLIGGLALPIILWLLLNTGILSAPVWPQITPLSSGLGAWWNTFEKPAAMGVLMCASFWAGVTLWWLVAQVGARLAERRPFWVACGSWALLIVPLFAFALLFGGIECTGIGLTLSGLLLLCSTMELTDTKPLRPSYSRAQAKLAFGKYAEAEAEVIRELEQAEDDFEGWMFLAELYAMHFHDLPAADETVRDLCEHPATTPVQVSIALHRLADWHLKLAQDPVTARRLLARICERMPGTHLDRMARQRIAQLPASREELIARERGKPLVLPPAPDEVPTAQLTPDEARAAAAECVVALEQNPDDVSAREKLARLFAEHLSEADRGIEQLELLLAMPNQSPAKRAEWLVLMAGWHARLRNDRERARAVYGTVLRDYPDTPHALAAQRRLNLLNLQAQFRSRAAERATAAL